MKKTIGIIIETLKEEELKKEKEDDKEITQSDKDLELKNVFDVNKFKCKTKILSQPIILKEEDIYNIISTSYTYEFKMINKKDYDLNIEKGKLEIIEVSNNLLSFDADNNINERIIDNEVDKLYELLKNKFTKIIY